MTPVQVLLVLVLCGAFRAQLIVTEEGASLNPEKTTEEEDMRDLLQQLQVRVEQLEKKLEKKLEKEREDQGQSEPGHTEEPAWSTSGAHEPCRDQFLVEINVILINKGLNQ